MHFDPVTVFFQVIVLLFAISVHESAHAWMANRLGDPTAKMLGRISLNPIVHIDPIGSLLVPGVMILFGLPPFGWAKPTPVDTRNFKNLVKDDILTSVAGPVSNFITAFLSVAILAFVLHGSTTGIGRMFRGTDVAAPLAQMFELAILINVVLAVFNLIPLPPLDGSHVIRHFLPHNTLQTFDRFGYFGLILVIFVLPRVGFPIVDILITPFLAFYGALLNFFLRF